MSELITNGLTILVENTGATYHTLNDWGLYVSNTDYIKEPEQNVNYVSVPGRDGYIDLSEAVSGRVTYLKRSIDIRLSGLNDKTQWDSVMSSIRNKINGRICHFIFDNTPTWYWRGRVDVNDFSHSLKLGVFNIRMPNADPYKYSVYASNDPWLWDPFNFETDMITQIGEKTISGSGSITIPAGHMPVCPEIIVAAKTSSTFTVTFEGLTYTLALGSNKIPAIMVGGEEDAVLDFTGSAAVQIVYRAGSL